MKELVSPETDVRVAWLSAAGLFENEVAGWIADLDAALATGSERASMEQELEQAGGILRRGRAFLDSLPLKSQRNSPVRAAGETVVDAMAELCERVFRVHRESMYARLTGNYERFLRVDDLVWRAAEQWPGLLPSREEVRAEQARMQMDKDGLEIHQGIFLSHVFTECRAGLHLLKAMLRPKEESVELLPELVERGHVDLGTVRVEVRGQVGYVSFGNPGFLNAEDETLIEPQETAIDLVLLHPDVKMGVLRGDVVEHPRYRGRRVFDAGINLTKIYHGQIGYVSFYIARDLGLVNKLYRGLVVEEWEDDEPENTVEKPWLAANRKALRVQQEPLDDFRAYMATYCREQAYCHLSNQLIANLERHWNATERSLR